MRPFPLVLVALLAGYTQGAARAELRAGAARASITPDVQAQTIPLGGYAARRGAPATGIHDAVYARALVLANGGTTLAVVSCDLCFLPANLKAEVLRRLPGLGVPDLDDAHLLLCATHSHTAPDPLAMHEGNTFQNIKGWTPYNADLTAFTVKGICAAIKEAFRTLAPATLRTFRADGTGLNRNRRGDPLTDGQITGLEVLAANRRIVVVNYAAHPTLYSDKMRDISADWPGVLAAAIEKREGADSICLFLNGAEGDAAPNGAAGATETERVNNYGHTVAARILPKLQAGKEGRGEQEAVLDAWEQPVSLPARRPTGMFLVAAAQLGLSIGQGREFVTRLMPVRTSLHFVRVGSLLLIGFPCEPSGALGLQVKALARKAGYAEPCVVALADDWLAYALTPEQYKAGRYEAMMSFYGEQFGLALLQAAANGLGHKTPTAPAKRGSP